MLEGQEIEQTLVSSLGPCVDSIRDLYTCLGARVYQVALVWTQWSGGARGQGAEDIIAYHRILPTPLVRDLTGIRRELEMIGLDEVGTLRVTQISPRFDEDVLVGQSLVVESGAAIPKDMNFYWEIFFPRADSDGVRRRFVPKSVPSKRPTRFEWVIDLLKASEDRTREGELRG